MKSLVIVVVVVIGLALTAPFNEAARQRINQRQEEQSLQLQAEAVQIEQEAAAFNAQVASGNLAQQAENNVRNEFLGRAAFWIILVAGMALLFITLAAVLLGMLFGKDWTAYQKAQREVRKQSAELERLSAEIRRTRQERLPQSPVAPPTRAPAPPSAPVGNAAIIETRVARSNREPYR